MYIIMVVEDIGKYIECYDKLATDVLHKPLDPAYSARFADLKEFMLDTTYDVVLDVGSSDGIFLQSIEAQQKIAFDISQVFLKTIKSDLIPVRGNAECLPFKSKSFDTIIASDILEHVFHPDKVIREMRRVIKTPGKFYMVVPWEEDISVYEKFKGKYDYCHLREFDYYRINHLITHNFGEVQSMRMQGSLPSRIPGLWRTRSISQYMYKLILKHMKPVHMMVEVIV